MSRASRTALDSQRKPFTARPSCERDRPDRQRRRHAGDEAAEALRRQLPDLELDAALGGRSAADESGLGGLGVGQRVQAVGGRGAGRLQPPRAERDELAVERLAGQVRPDDRQRHGPGGRLAGDRAALLVAPVGGQRQQRVVAAVRRDERHAEGKAVGAQAGRHGDRAQVEQVDEVRVRAQQGVAGDRRLGDLGRREDGGRGRQQQRVGLLPHARSLGRQLAQAVGGLEGLDRADVASAHDDLAHDRIDGVAVGGDERAHGCVALGDPRTVVEQRPGLGERGEVDLGERPAECRRARQRVLPRRGSVRVAAELELVGAGDRDPRARPRAPRQRGALRARAPARGSTGRPGRVRRRPRARVRRRRCRL